MICVDGLHIVVNVPHQPRNRYIERVGWNKSEVQRQLQQRFGKTRQVQLDIGELTHWLTFLEGIT
jgi:hypothetical protein